MPNYGHQAISSVQNHHLNSNANFTSQNHGQTDLKTSKNDNKDCWDEMAEQQENKWTDDFMEQMIEKMDVPH